MGSMPRLRNHREVASRGRLMTVQELDRLVSKTDINPISLSALKSVRKAVMSGRCGNPDVGEGSWTISIDTEVGRQVRMSFSFKRDK